MTPRIICPAIARRRAVAASFLVASNLACFAGISRAADPAPNANADATPAASVPFAPLEKSGRPDTALLDPLRYLYGNLADPMERAANGPFGWIPASNESEYKSQLEDFDVVVQRLLQVRRDSLAIAMGVQTARFSFARVAWILDQQLARNERIVGLRRRDGGDMVVEGAGVLDQLLRMTLLPSSANYGDAGRTLSQPGASPSRSNVSAFGAQHGLAQIEEQTREWLQLLASVPPADLRLLLLSRILYLGSYVTTPQVRDRLEQKFLTDLRDLGLHYPQRAGQILVSRLATTDNRISREYGSQLRGKARTLTGANSHTAALAAEMTRWDAATFRKFFAAGELTARATELTNAAATGPAVRRIVDEMRNPGALDYAPNAPAPRSVETNVLLSELLDELARRPRRFFERLEAHPDLVADEILKASDDELLSAAKRDRAANSHETVCAVLENPRVAQTFGARATQLTLRIRAEACTQAMQ